MPAVVKQLAGYHRWADRRLKRLLRETNESGRDHLHASLALLPFDSTQAAYLGKRLLAAPPDELLVLRTTLKPHAASLVPKLWAALDAGKPGDADLLPAAAALAVYDARGAGWATAGAKVALALATMNSTSLGFWLDALRPVRSELIEPLAAIFRDQQRTETVHSQVTDILIEYASNEPVLVAGLLLDADFAGFRSLFPVARGRAAEAVPTFRAELAQVPARTWNDSPPADSWATPGADLVKRIERAHGMVADRFVFCQTMPLDLFLGVAQELARSGYRPVRLRPFGDGKIVRAAAVWARDGRLARITTGESAAHLLQMDDRNRQEHYLAVDVAGFVAFDGEGRRVDRYAALWIEDSAGDDARIVAGIMAEGDEGLEGPRDVLLVGRTMQVNIGPDDRPRYSGVWGRPPSARAAGTSCRDLFEATLEQNLIKLSDRLLVDLAVCQAPAVRSKGDHVAAARTGPAQLAANPDDAGARFARALASFRLGENQQAVDDLEIVIGKNPDAATAKEYRAIILARLGKTMEAKAELEKLEKSDIPDYDKLYLASAVAAELGLGLSPALLDLETAIRQEPDNAALRYRAARAWRWHRVLSRDPIRARGIGSGSARCNCSGMQSSATMPTSARWTKTPTSTRFATTRRLPRS